MQATTTTMLVIFIWFILIDSSMQNVRTNNVTYGDHTTLVWSSNTTLTNSSHINCYAITKGGTFSLGNGTDMIDFHGSRILLRVEPTQVLVTISNASFHDTGQYTCSINNITQAYNVTVFGGPVLVSDATPNDVIAESDGSFEVRLIACGFPKPRLEISWFNKFYNVNGSELSAEDLNMWNISLWEGVCFSYYQSIQTNSFTPTCNASIFYSLNGYKKMMYARPINIITGNVMNVRTVATGNGCLQTFWNGPLSDPASCNQPIIFRITVRLNNQSERYFPTFSNAFQICNTDVDVTLIERISVSLASTVNTEVTSIFNVDSKNDDDNNSDDVIILILSISLGVLMFLFLLTCCWVCCRNHPALTTCCFKKRSKKKKINKNNIIHRPRNLSQVTGKAVNKSHTFNGTTYMNRYTDEPTLKRGFMPLNTLQKRITESLNETYRDPSRSMSVFSDISSTQSAATDDDLQQLTRSEQRQQLTKPPSEQQNRRRPLSTSTFVPAVPAKRSQTFTAADRNMRPVSFYDLPRCIQKTLKTSGTSASNLVSNAEIIYANSRPSSRQEDDVISARDMTIDINGEDDDSNVEFQIAPLSPVSHYDRPYSYYDQPSPLPKNEYDSPRFSAAQVNDYWNMFPPEDREEKFPSYQIEKTSDTISPYATSKDALQKQDQNEVDLADLKSKHLYATLSSISPRLNDETVPPDETSENSNVEEEQTNTQGERNDEPNKKEGIYADIYTLFRNNNNNNNIDRSEDEDEES